MKMLTWLTIRYGVKEDTPQTYRTVCEISRETGISLRCYEITIMGLVAALYWNHSRPMPQQDPNSHRFY